MFKRWRWSQLSAERKPILLNVVLALVYIILWTLYFLGFFPVADKKL
jgi:hypothetical protein